MAQEVANLRRNVDTMLQSMRATQLGNSSIENDQLVIRDEFGNIRDVYGRLDDGTFGNQPQNAPTPPSRPNTPVLTPIAAGFRIEWNGELIAVKPLDFKHIEIHVGETPDFIVNDSTFTGTLSTAGSWIEAPRPYGNTYYVLFIAVNTSDLKSEPSLIASVQPSQVVAQAVLDGIVTEVGLANDAVTKAKIAADAVDGTKIEDNSISSNLIIADAIQTLHIATGAVSANEIAANAVTATAILAGSVQADKIAANAIEAGHIQAGAVTAAKLEAEMVLASTILIGDPTGGRVQLNPLAGLELYAPDGTTRTGHWDPATGTITTVGNFLTAVPGTAVRHIRVLTDGTLRFYHEDGVTFSQMVNVGTDVVWRGPLDTNMRSGRVNVNKLGVGINFSKEADLLENIRSEIVVVDRQVRTTAPFISLNVDERWTSTAGGVNSGRRVQFGTINSSGDFIAKSGISYMTDSNDWGGMVGNDTGWKLQDFGGGIGGRFTVTNGDMTDWGVARSDGWELTSSATEKTAIQDARAVLNPIATIRGVRAKAFKYSNAPDSAPPTIGVIAEDLPEVLQRPAPPDRPEAIAIDLGSQMGVMWGALNQFANLQIVSTSAVAVLQKAILGPGGTFAADATAEVAVTWDSVPPAAPSGGLAQLNSSFVWAGKVTAWIKTGSVTADGCTVVFKNISNSTIVVNEASDALRVSASVTGLGIYIPPYVPEE
jgi:hypothetical protein